MKFVFNIANLEELNLLKSESSTNIEAVIAQICKHLADKKDYFVVKTPLGSQFLFEVIDRMYWNDEIQKIDLTFVGFYHE